MDQYDANIQSLTSGPANASAPKALNAEVVENKLGGMLTELQAMSKSLGSLKALQEVDFSKTGDQLKTMNNFYTKMNDAMAALNSSLEDTKQYQTQMASLSKNLTSLNGVYGNILSAYNVKG